MLLQKSTAERDSPSLPEEQRKQRTEHASFILRLLMASSYLSPKALFSISAFFTLFLFSLFCSIFFTNPYLSLYRDLWLENPHPSNSSTTSHPAIPPLLTPSISPSLTPNPISPQKVIPQKPVKPEKGDGSSDQVAESTLHFQNAKEKKVKSKGVNWVDQKCDLYSGYWVKDENHPLYHPGSCPHIDDAFTCQDNGRPDSDYMKWRWKPNDCYMPRFNATDFLERIRGKRLMLVGDSMNRNQFESMLCLLYEALPDKSRMYETRGNKVSKGRGYFVFRFKDYDCTVEFCRSHYLVKEGTRRNSQGKSRATLSIDRIDKSASRWKRADILIFNTGHWWTHGKTSKGKDYYQEGNFIYPHFDAVEAYKRAMRTWGRWIDENINPKKKLVFYRGYSSAHFRGGDWDSGGTCNGEKDPIMSGPFLNSYPQKMKIVEEVLHEMKFPVILLNVTRLTNFRKDGHPSVYRRTSTKGQQVSKRRQDCSHWCLPGVPDAWNELVYASLTMHRQPSVAWN